MRSKASPIRAVRFPGEVPCDYRPSAVGKLDRRRYRHDDDGSRASPIVAPAVLTISRRLVPYLKRLFSAADSVATYAVVKSPPRSRLGQLLPLTGLTIQGFKAGQFANDYFVATGVFQGHVAQSWSFPSRSTPAVPIADRASRRGRSR